MSYTVIELITEAYYASGIVSRGFETVSGSQMNDGLKFLNKILADSTIEKDMIPYFSVYQWFVTAGVEQYYIPNLESPDTLVFFLDNVRYQMRYITRKAYRGSSRPNNITSLPFNWNYERCPGGGIISLYFFPQENYPLQLWGLFRLTNVMLGQDLTSAITTVNLGTVFITGTPLALGNTTILGTGVLAAGELVINGVDLAGTYASVSALAVAINTTVPNTTATVVGSAITLSNSVAALTVTTLGTVGVNGVTFANFSTTGGPLTVTKNAPGTLLPAQFVVNGVDLQGVYPTAVALSNYINTGVIPNVRSVIIQNQLYLFNTTGSNYLSTNTVNTNSAINLVSGGMFGLESNVSFANFSTNTGPLDQTYLPMLLDMFYINYLEMRLAQRMCTYFNYSIPPNVAQLLSEYQEGISKRSAPMDLTQTKISSFSSGATIDWAQVNLGLGWYAG